MIKFFMKISISKKYRIQNFRTASICGAIKSPRMNTGTKLYSYLLYGQNSPPKYTFFVIVCPATGVTHEHPDQLLVSAQMAYGA